MANEAIPVTGIDHLELFVGNARQAAHYYQTALGFRLTAYSGPETSVRDAASYVLEQGMVRLVLTTAITQRHPGGTHVMKHGDSVRDIALIVADVDDAYHLALTRGATGVEEPRTLEDAGGALRRAAIAVYGDTIHTLIDRSGYRGVFAPLYEPLDGLVSGGPAVGLRAIDHVVANVEEGRMDEWADFYARVFGFTQLVSFDDKDISTEYSALRSKVMRNASGTVKLPINEPARGRRKSQIQEYLDYGGPGVQHIALATEGIIPTVSAMRERGVPFLEAPPSYYQKVPARIGRIAESLNDLQRLSILADRDEDGYLLQIFTLPVEDRPTLFYEIIQRAGSQSFGKGNFKELFEAIEREQARRGNLEEAVGAPL